MMENRMIGDRMTYWPDVRRRRAQALTATVMQIVGKRMPHAENRELRDICRDIEDTLRGQGYEVLNDLDRETLGFPPRGPDGWTIDELRALEAKRLEVLTRPMPPIFMPVNPA